MYHTCHFSLFYSCFLPFHTYSSFYSTSPFYTPFLCILSYFPFLSLPFYSRFLHILSIHISLSPIFTPFLLILLSYLSLLLFLSSLLITDLSFLSLLSVFLSLQLILLIILSTSLLLLSLVTFFLCIFFPIMSGCQSSLSSCLPLLCRSVFLTCLSPVISFSFLSKACLCNLHPVNQSSVLSFLHI